MTHDQVVAVLTYLYPGVAWAYDGDGTTLGPVAGVSYGLIWHGSGTAPTLADLEAALPTVEALPSPPTQAEKVAAALQTIQNDSALDAATQAALSAVVKALT